MWHPVATRIKQNARGTNGDNRVNCNRIPRAAMYDIPSAPSGNSGWQKIALIPTGLYAARIRATLRFHHADHRNRSGTNFFAPHHGIVCLWTEISYIWHPDATLIKQNARGIAGDNRVNCNRIPRAAVYDILPAPPGDSAAQKIALIATGLKPCLDDCFMVSI